MATSSEIQVTEAYIGLLGRAPDPAGLAYWAAELDAAIAAGQDPAVALKKLTNDITLNDEWLVDGDGSLDVTGGTDAQNLANAETVVTNMYDRLFDRTPDEDEVDYWAPKIVSGEFTSSEMAVALIQGAGTTDAGTLGFKQEAATYYVENVAQEDFSRETANSAVADVNSPLSLKTSKENTDTLVSGEGITATLTTAANTVAMTNGDDTVTGTVGTGATFNVGDSILDTNTKDNDTLTLTGDSGFTFGATSNIENLNVSLSARELTRFTIDADNDTGGSTINLTVADSVTVAGVALDGETRVTLNNLASDLTTTNVTEMVVTLDTGADQTLDFDADLATLDLSAVDANGTAVTLANNDVTFAVSGTTATNDAMSVTADNEVTITHGAQDVELLTLSGSDNDVAFTIASVATPAKMSYTIAGDNDVTLIGNVNQFSSSAFSNTGAGDVTLQLSGVAGANASIENFGVLGGGITLTAAGGDYDVLSLAAGNTVTIQAAAADVAFNANDSATDSAITINANTSTAALDTVKFESVTINTNDSSAVDLGAVDFGGAKVTVGGTNDITINTSNDMDTLSVVGDDVVLDGALTNANSVTLTGTNDADAVAMTVNNDVTLTAGDESSVTGTVTITAGDLTITAGDSIDVDAIDVAAGDITLTTTDNEIGMSAAVDTDAGSLSVTAGTSVTAAGAIGANDVTISAGTTVAITGAITSNNDVSITSAVGNGNDLDLDAAITATAGNVTITGDALDTAAAADVTVTAGNITVTTYNEVTAIAGDLKTSAGTVTVDAGTSITNISGAIDGNDVDIDAVKGIKVSGAITADNDVSITSLIGNGNDLNLDAAITATAGNVTITGDAIDTETSADVNVTAGNITVTSFNEATDIAGDLKTSAGTVTVNAGTEITVLAGAVDANDVDIDATTDIKITGAITADNDVSITTKVGDGNDLDLDGAITVSGVGNVTITGDAIDTETSADVDVTAGNITVTSFNEVTDIAGDLETDAGTVTVNAGTEITVLAGAVDANDVDIDATTDIKITGAITADNDVSITTLRGDGNDLDLDGAITASVGNVTITGDALDSETSADVNVTSGDITVITYNEITDLAGDLKTVSGTVTVDAGSAITAATGAIEANEVDIDAKTTIAISSTIKAENDVTITTVNGGGNDITLDGTIDVLVSGNVEITGDDITIQGAGDIDVEKGNVTIIAANNATIDDPIDTASGTITITAGGTLDLSAAGGAITATNDIKITSTGDMTFDGDITTSLGDLYITGNEVDSANAGDDLTATAGSVTLNMSNDSRVQTSTIQDVTAGAGDVTIENGQWNIQDITASRDVIIEGDVIATIANVTAGSLVITSNNDVTISTETNTGFVVSTGSNDIDLGTVRFDAANDTISITTGSGNDTMVLDDDTSGGSSVVSVFEVNTGGGDDDVTITDDGVAAASIINLGAGDDTVAHNEDTDAVTVIMGAGDDSATVDADFKGSIDFGADTDTLTLTAADHSSGGVWTNVEVISLAGAVTLSEAQLDNDSTFALQGTSGEITVASAASVDLSNVTFAFGWSDGFTITAANTGGVITGSSADDTLNGDDGANDVLSGGAGADSIKGLEGADTLTGGTGADIFLFTDNDSSGTEVDAITDFAISADKLDFEDAGTEHVANDTTAIDVSAADADSGTVTATVVDGVITLAGADAANIDTLAEWLAVAELVVEDAEAGNGDDVVLIAFEFGGSTYVAEFSFEDTGDTAELFNVVKLTGITGITALDTSAAANTVVIQ
jgi:hypothetical protein